MFTKKTTGVEIGEFFMRVGEKPQDAVQRAKREYDLPQLVYYDTLRNVLKVVKDGNSIPIETGTNIVEKDTSKESSNDDLPSITNQPELSSSSDNGRNNNRSIVKDSRIKLGKVSDLGMGIPRLKSVDKIELDEDSLKTKPFFKKKKVKGKLMKDNTTEFDKDSSEED